MHDLQELRLGDLGAPTKSAFSTGPFGSSVSSVNFRESGIPMLRGSNLSEDIGTRLDDRTLVYLEPGLAAQFKRSWVTLGDLIFTCWGTVGQIALIDKRSQFKSYIISNKQMKMTPDPERVNPLFLYYLLSQPHMVDVVKAQAIGSSVPGFNLGQLKELIVQLPSLRVQRGIADTLGALDDKIAGNSRLSSTARDLAYTEFKIALSTASVASSIGSIMTLEYGKALPADVREPGMAAVYGSGGVVGTHVRALVQGPAVIVGRKGTAGAVYWSPGPAYPIDTTFYVVPKEKSTSLIYCYFALSSAGLTERNSDSAVPGLNRSDVYSLQVALPDPNAMSSISAQAENLFAVAAQFDDESRALAAMRDTLLPALMSGKLRVKDAEKQLEEVL